MMRDVYRLRLLGPLQIEGEEGPVRGFVSRKAVGLLSYMALQSQPVNRSFLADLFWSDKPESRGRANLSRVLHNLSTLVPDCLQADRHTVQFRRSATIWLDVAAFDECVASGQMDSLAEAVTLYRDEFLAGFFLNDCPEFETWLVVERERWHQQVGQVLQKLIDHHAQRGEHEQGLSFASRLLELDPWREEAHQQMMLLLAQSGQRTAALAQYEACRRTLAEELGVEPAEETTELYERIRDGELSRRARKPNGAQAEAHPRRAGYKQGSKEEIFSSAPRPYRPPVSVPSPPMLNLPSPPTSFIGREAELAALDDLFADSNVRLVTIVGPGGIGKTRLAIQAAHEMITAFAQGVCFVPLTPISNADYLPSAMADALNLKFYGSKPPQEQLLNHLRDQQLLLLLDNFEHILAGADLLSEILLTAPQVKLLVTSRERLRLQEEWIYEVHGLAYPDPASATSEVLGSYSAVELFTQRARQITASFAPSEDEMADIGRICQLVEGMPLGLELAAPWIRTLSCREIAAEIEHSLDFLTTTLRNVPERHRSLRVVFEQTWGRLSHAEQSVLMQLSVFRGGCTREAAEAVTGATLPVLSSLVDRALLRRANTGRYELHELIRQFAEVQLQTDTNAIEQAQKRHCDYFTAFLEQRNASVKGHGQKETLAEIKADIDNVRLVWRRAVANRDIEAIERSAECLFMYYLYTSGHYEGRAAFKRAAMALIEDSSPSIDGSLPDELVVLEQQENQVGFLLAAQGYFLAHTTLGSQAGQALLEQALALLRRAERSDLGKEAFALLWLGWAHFHGGKLPEATSYAEQSLPAFAETADPWGEGWSRLLWGLCVSYSRPTEAEEVFKKALTVGGGDQSVLGYANHCLGFVTTVLGQYTQAKQYIDEAVKIFEELDSKLGLGYAFNKRGELAIPQGEYRQAIQTLQQAIDYFNEARTPMNVAYCQIWIAMTFRLRGDYGQAEQLYRQTLAEVTAVNNPQLIAFCLTGLGCLAYDRGELPRAERFHREALDAWRQIEQEVGETAALGHLGHVLAASSENRHAEARQYFRQALDLAIKHQVAPIALDVCVGVARLLAQAGETERAVEHLALAEQHEASTFETKEKACKLLAEMVDKLPSEMEQAAQAQGRTRDLWTTAEELLVELGPI